MKTSFLKSGLHAARRRTNRRVISTAFCAGALLSISGCSRVSQLATEAVAGKTVADKMAQSEGTRDKTAKAAQDEATRQNNDARVLLGQHLYTSWAEFRTQPNPPQANQNIVWTLNIWQSGKPAKNNNWVDEFQYSHEKLLRLTIVSRDLSYFNRLYPDFRGDGLFITSTTLPHSGDFKAFADYTPMRGVPEVAQHDFKVAGKTPNAASVVLDTPTNGWLVKNVASHPESQPDTPRGDIYNVALEATPFVAGKTALLRFVVRDARHQIGSDLQPYLGAAGIVSIVSADTKIYLNADVVDDASRNSSTRSASGNATDVTFETVFPAAGVYKIWAQFQYENRVITAPFVIDVRNFPKDKR